MSDTLNVLSIDFDYFQVVDADTMIDLYPDGHDLSTSLSEVVWMDKYLYHESNKRIMTVKANKTELGILKSLLKKQDPTIDVLVVNSHKTIYDAIKEKMAHKKNLHIDHIDMHHDMFNEGHEVDCGNWLGYLFKEYPSMSATWVANPISREVFGLEDPKFDMIKSSIKDLGDKQYDFVFLCRSDCWLPPHLDGNFNKLYDFMCDYFPFLRYTDNITSPRKVCYSSFLSQKDGWNADALEKAYGEIAKRTGNEIKFSRMKASEMLFGKE